MISEISYAAVAIISFLFGTLYLFKKRCMPYHIKALDKEWNMIPKEVRVLALALMRVAGGGFIAISISISYLLYSNANQSSQGNLAILIIGLVGLLPSLWATQYVKKYTKGNPPVLTAYISIGILLLGYLFSLFQ